MLQKWLTAASTVADHKAACRMQTAVNDEHTQNTADCISSGSLSCRRKLPTDAGTSSHSVMSAYVNVRATDRPTKPTQNYSCPQWHFPWRTADGHLSIALLEWNHIAASLSQLWHTLTAQTRGQRSRAPLFKLGCQTMMSYPHTFCAQIDDWLSILWRHST